MKIEALHDFHDAAFSKGWSDRFNPTPERLALFNTILQQINTLASQEIDVLELGIGPGYLAAYLLEHLPTIQYEGLDFSKPMLAIAEERTVNFKNRITFTQADLVKEQWQNKLKRKPTVIVTTWALHDLFKKDNIQQVYQAAFEVLPKGGIFLNGDFIKPETSPYEYEGGRIKPSEHIELLRTVGFTKVACISMHEVAIENPTTANNYACFKAEK